MSAAGGLKGHAGESRTIWKKKSRAKLFSFPPAFAEVRAGSNYSSALVHASTNHNHIWQQVFSTLLNLKSEDFTAESISDTAVFTKKNAAALHGPFPLFLFFSRPSLHTTYLRTVGVSGRVRLRRPSPLRSREPLYRRRWQMQVSHHRLQTLAFFAELSEKKENLILKRTLCLRSGLG